MRKTNMTKNPETEKENRKKDISKEQKMFK